MKCGVTTATTKINPIIMDTTNKHIEKVTTNSPDHHSPTSQQANH